ncbi:MAG: primosomal replication protein [Vibrio sp.]
MKFDEISTHLDTLAQQAAQRDRQTGEHHQALFDEQLFHCRARLLTPYVSEAKSTLESIIREHQAKRLTQLRAEHLSQRLLAQISALKRELATSAMRGQEPKHWQHNRKPINHLYQELAKHQEWELRLKDLVLAKKYALSQTSGPAQVTAQKALIATEQRLSRCQAAKLKIEKQITFRETTQNKWI